MTGVWEIVLVAAAVACVLSCLREGGYAASDDQRPAPGRDLALDQSVPGELREGEIAPDFELVPLEPGPAEDEAASKPRTPGPPGPGTVRLSSFRGERPVVLIFTSYT